MKQIENTLQDLKSMLIEDGYTEANIVMRTLIKAQDQVKNCSIPDVVGRSEQLKCYNQYMNAGTLQGEAMKKCLKCGEYVKAL